MRIIALRAFAAASVASACAAFPVAASAQETVIGLTNSNTLFRFQTNAPNVFTSLSGVGGVATTVTGLQTGDVLRSIDFRPSTGVLYGLTSNNTTLRLYTLNTTTGAATLQSTLTAVAGNDGTNPVAVTPFAFSDNWAIDFNPQADALRILDRGLGNDPSGNYRISSANLTTGTTFSDAVLVRPNADDFTLFGTAYTNNVANATSTTLLTLIQGGVAEDTLYQQGNPSPNDGTLNLLPASARGNTGTSFGLGDLDISGDTGNLYWAGGSVFRQLDPTNGAVLASLSFGGNSNVRGLSVVSNAAVVAPEPGSFALCGGVVGLIGLVTRRKRNVTK